MNSPRHSVSVAAVITDDHGRALLIQRRDNHTWEPPGGVLELSLLDPDLTATFQLSLLTLFTSWNREPLHHDSSASQAGGQL